MSRLRESIAIMIEERGGQAFACDEDEINAFINLHNSHGRTVWIFRKSETCLPTRISGSGLPSCSGELFPGLP